MNKRIGLVLTSNYLYKNAFINSLAKKKSDNIAVIFELSFKNPKTSKKEHYLRYIKMLRLKGLIYLTTLNVINKLKIFFSNIFLVKNGYSLKQIARKNNITYYKIKNVNNSEFINLIEKHQIGYIINSANQIYKKEILNKVNVLNRHTSLLPAYGGIYPVFWQLLNKDYSGGVTLHWIDENIDEGKIAYQKSFTIDPNKSLFWHYKIAFKNSLEVCIEAINDLNKGDVKQKELKGIKSYYSWPNNNNIKNFFKMGNKIV